MPVILWQVWGFVTPGLYPHEKRYAVPFTISAIVLFLFGAAIAYITLNPALQFLIDVGGSNFEQIFSPDSYVKLIAFMMLAFGAGFEFPVLLVRGLDRRGGRGDHAERRPHQHAGACGTDVCVLRDIHPHWLARRPARDQ